MSSENVTEEAVSENPEPSEQQGAGSEEAPSESAEAPSEVMAADLARLKDQLLRMAADFDNYRKRSRKDVQEAERRAQEELVRALLPTIDNVERATKHAQTATDLKGLIEGLEMVSKQFHDALSGLGIERVGDKGVAFDPTEHEAVQNVETTEVPPGAVADVLQPGYRWKGRLVRPALVVVAKGPAANPE